MFTQFSEEKSRRDKSGQRWNFCYWRSHDFEEKSRDSQRLFFWDDAKTDCGVVLFLPGKTVSYSHVKSMIPKLVADSTLRKQYQRELRFPLEYYYPEFGAFAEETGQIETHN